MFALFPHMSDMGSPPQESQSVVRPAAGRTTLWLSLLCRRRRPVVTEPCDFCQALSRAFLPNCPIKERRGTIAAEVCMERREAWSADPGAFCVPERLNAPRHARCRAP